VRHGERIKQMIAARRRIGAVRYLPRCITYRPVHAGITTAC
jgi:hypothetical protein